MKKTSKRKAEWLRKDRKRFWEGEKKTQSFFIFGKKRREIENRGEWKDKKIEKLSYSTK